jgi:hypothetical protein
MLGSQFRNLNFWRLMIRSWKMLIREVEEWTSTLNFGQWMCSMNGDYFVILTQGNILFICLKTKIQSRTLWICCHLLFCKLQKKMVTYIIQLGTIFYHFLNVFIIGVFFFIMCFSCFCLVYASTCYMFLSIIRFRIYVKALGLGSILRFRFRV